MQHVMELFDLVLESSKEGIRKPNPAFYLRACERLRIKPNQAVFLDDLGINLKPAKELGMTTIKVTSEDQAIAELSERTADRLQGHNELTQARGRLFRRQVALRFRQHLETDHELAHAGRAQQRRIDVRMQLPVHAVIAAAPVPAHRVRKRQVEQPVVGRQQLRKNARKIGNVDRVEIIEAAAVQARQHAAFRTATQPNTARRRPIDRCAQPPARRAQVPVARSRAEESARCRHAASRHADASSSRAASVGTVEVAQTWP